MFYSVLQNIFLTQTSSETGSGRRVWVAVTPPTGRPKRVPDAVGGAWVGKADGHNGFGRRFDVEDGVLKRVSDAVRRMTDVRKRASDVVMLVLEVCPMP